MSSFLYAFIINELYPFVWLRRNAVLAFSVVIIVSTLSSAQDIKPKQSLSAANAAAERVISPAHTRARKDGVTSKQSTAVPVASSAQVAAARDTATQTQQVAQPNSLQTVLYDQTNNPSGVGTNSQNFEAANDALDNQVADDFVVPAGGWEIGQVNVKGQYFNGSGPANSVNVFFYFNAATFPGAPVPGGTYTAIPITVDMAGNFTILLPTSLTLAPGTYWLSVQANMDSSAGGQWLWNDRTVQTNSGAAFRNPGGGLGCSGGNSWVRKPTCVTGAAPDNLFQLLTPGGIFCPRCPAYTTATSTGNSIVPGTTDIGNHDDDITAPITLPFAVTLFGTTFPAGATIQASSNGNLQFTGDTNSAGATCPLPDIDLGMAILAYQNDLLTNGAGDGIYTSISGVAPNRIFNIEWRTTYLGREGTANFEVRLYESSNCFDIIYGATVDNGGVEVSGVQDSATNRAVQFACNTPTLTPGLKVTYCPNSCPAPMPTSAVSRKVHGAAGTYDINLPIVPLNGAIGIEDRAQGAAGPVVLWYNGDFNGVNGLPNEKNTTTIKASVYDNFVVTAPGGWDIKEVFSNNLSTTVIGGATWEIRKGVSAGNGGTLVASGSTLSPTVTSTGRSGFGFTEYQVKVTGLNVHLPALPADQFYWLNVTPIGNGSGRCFDSDASGMSAIGTPPGNDMNAFWDSTDFSAVFLPTSDPSVDQPTDFSMGVIGFGAEGGGFNHQMVVTFPNPVAVDSVAVTAGSGSVASFSVSGAVVTINLIGVTNAQRVGVTLKNVCNGTISGDVMIPMGLLIGDTSGNGSTNGSDVSQTKARSGQAVTGSNFRSDVTANGSINGSDVSQVKIRSGTALP